MKYVAKLIPWVLFAIVASALIFLWNEREEILFALTRLNTFTFSSALMLTAIVIFIRFIRYRRIVSDFGHEIPTSQGLRFYVAGFAFALTPGRAGEAIRAVWLKSLGIPTNVSVYSTAIERIQDLIALGGLALVGFMIFGQSGPVFGSVLGFVVIFGLAVLLFGWLPPFLRRTLVATDENDTQAPQSEAPSSSFLGAIRGTLRRQAILIAQYRPTPLNLALNTALSLSIWLVGAYLFFLLTWKIGLVHVPYTTLVGIYAISLFVGTLTMLPGGVGGVEASMSLMLVAHNVPFHEAATVVILGRSFLFWLPVLIGIVCVPRRN